MQGTRAGPRLWTAWCMYMRCDVLPVDLHFSTRRCEAALQIADQGLIRAARTISRERRGRGHQRAERFLVLLVGNRRGTRTFRCGVWVCHKSERFTLVNPQLLSNPSEALLSRLTK